MSVTAFFNIKHNVVIRVPRKATGKTDRISCFRASTGNRGRASVVCMSCEFIQGAKTQLVIVVLALIGPAHVSVCDSAPFSQNLCMYALVPGRPNFYVSILFFSVPYVMLPPTA